MRPLAEYVPLLESGELRKSLRSPVLVWTAPLGVLDESKELTRTEADGRKGSAEALVLELVARGEQHRCLTVGRASTCDIQVAAGSISRRHVELMSTSHGWTACDLGSKNGTWIGETRLGTNAPAALTDGARLKVGDVELLFLLPESFERYVSQLKTNG